jgi:TctA family transporter
MSTSIFIPVNRKKMILMTVLYAVLGLLVFMAVYLVGQNQNWISPTIFTVISFAFLLFFLVVSGTYARYIKLETAGLSISQVGIDDQSSSINFGLVKWQEILGVTTHSTASSKLLIVRVKKPNKYIEGAKNAAIKRLLNQNLTIYKTPVVINVNVLSTNLAELMEQINRHRGKFGTNK